MTLDDSDDPLVAREDVEPLDAQTLVPESDHRVGPDENDEEAPVATKATVAPSDSRHEPGRGYDPALVTLYLNDVGRVALLTRERERDLIANLHATRAAFAGIAVQLPAIQEAILDALEPLLHRRVTKSPAVATELIDRTKLFRTLDRLHRTAGCRYAEVPRPLTCKLARTVRRLLEPVPIRGDFLLGILASLTAPAAAIPRTVAELDADRDVARRQARGCGHMAPYPAKLHLHAESPRRGSASLIVRDVAGDHRTAEW